MGNIQIYDYLIEQNETIADDATCTSSTRGSTSSASSSRGSVDPNAQDSWGNTVVHMVIIHNQRVCQLIYVIGLIVVE